MKKGFTLIELLILVLIIGVLTAMAVPQYQSAVQKSRFMGMLPATRSFKSAEEAVYMSEGQYTTNKADLSINISSSDIELTPVTNEEESYIRASKAGLNNRLVMYLAHSDRYANEIHCEAKEDSSIAKQVCLSSGSNSSPLVNGAADSAGYITYVLEGSGEDEGALGGNDEGSWGGDDGGWVDPHDHGGHGDHGGGGNNNNEPEEEPIVTFLSEAGFTSAPSFTWDPADIVSVSCDGDWCYGYDANNNKITSFDCGRSISSVSEISSCRFEGGTSWYMYDENNRLISERDAAGANPLNPGNYEGGNDYYYNENGLLIATRDNMGSDGGDYISGTNYYYDGDGNLISEEDCGDDVTCGLGGIMSDSGGKK